MSYPSFPFHFVLLFLYHSELIGILFSNLKKIFMAVLGLHCCAGAFSSCSKSGLLSVAVRMLLFVMASLIPERGLSACWRQSLQHLLSRTGCSGPLSAFSALPWHRKGSFCSFPQSIPTGTSQGASCLSLTPLCVTTAHASFSTHVQ